MRKTVYLLNVDGYAPEITAITYPLIRFYANRIGADVCMITERRFPKWPVTYEKLQIYKLAQERKSDWNIYIDSDAMVHPEMLDMTEHLSKDTVCHNGIDMAAIRWKYDRFFRRDGRNIGSCNWFTIASDWCVDLWKPLDMTPEEAVKNIRPTINEIQTVITPSHLIDDYALSHNIAEYGLKVTTVAEMLPKLGLPNASFFWHAYTIPTDEKVKRMKMVLEGVPGRMIKQDDGSETQDNGWNLPKSIRYYGM